jgi:hypothetical protein
VASSHARKEIRVTIYEFKMNTLPQTRGLTYKQQK